MPLTKQKDQKYIYVYSDSYLIYLIYLIYKNQLNVYKLYIEQLTYYIYYMTLYSFHAILLNKKNKLINFYTNKLNTKNTIQKITYYMQINRARNKKKQQNNLFVTRL